MKAQLPAISWNQRQPQDCSHMIVLAARKSMDETYVDRYMDSVAKTRGVPPESVAAYRNVLVSTVNNTDGQHLNWNARQVYIALVSSWQRLRCWKSTRVRWKESIRRLTTSASVDQHGLHQCRGMRFGYRHRKTKLRRLLRFVSTQRSDHASIDRRSGSCRSFIDG